MLKPEQKTAIVQSLQSCFLDMYQGAEGIVEYDKACYVCTGEVIEDVFNILRDSGIIDTNLRVETKVWESEEEEEE